MKIKRFLFVLILIIPFVNSSINLESPSNMINVTNITIDPNCADGEILKWSNGVGQCGIDIIGIESGIWNNDSDTAQFNGHINVTKDEWGIWTNETCIVIGNISMRSFC